MAICSSCGAQNSDEARFCEACGARLEEIVKAAPVTEMPDEDKFVPAPVPAPVQQNNQYQQQQQQTYYQNPQPQPVYNNAPQGGDFKTVCILALIFGCVAIVFDPFYLLSIAAIILGVVGHVNSKYSKNLAIAGWILGIISICIQVPIDILTLGVGLFC